MAGESPGKPEQKQSSGETAGSERDPRLAVFRETPAGEAKADEAGKADKSGTPGKADNGEKAAGAQGEGRDERLREAVAAWVATKDDDGAEGGSGEETGTGADAEKETRAKAEAGDAPVTKASADAGVGAGAGDGEAAGSGAAAEGAAKESADKSAKAPVKASAKGKGTAGESAGGAAEDASKDAPKGASKDAGKAAPAGGTKEAGPKAAAEGSAAGSAAKGAAAKGSGAKGSAAEGSAVKEKGASGAASEGASASVDQPTAIFKAPSLAEDGEASADEATRVFSIAKQKGSGDADPAKADTGSAAGDSAKGGAKNGAKGGKPDAEAAAPKSEKSAEGAAEKSAEKGDRKSAEKPTGKPAEKATGKSGAKTEPASGAKAGPKTEGKSAGKSDAGSASPVDQPTTAIKAVRPPGAAESDGERTSQFVALKSTDPQPIKSPRPVGGDKPGKAGKGGKQAAKDPAKTDDKPGTKPAAEPDVAPGTKWGAKAAATSGAATGTQPEAKSGAAEASATAAPAGTAAKSGATALPDSEQTRQQPLPPLDLLAQLTNTPPPPETPMRTIARRFKIWTPLVLLLLVVFVVVQQVRPLPSPSLALNGKTSFTFEGGSFQMPWPKEGQAAAKVVGAGSLGTYGEEKPVPTASVAKIMTAYVILKNHPLKVKEEGPKITIDAKAVREGNAPGESTIPGLKEGQQYSEAKMLQMLMIHSANNIARALARWDAGSEQEFAKKMNAAAQDLGMKNTTYTDPSGLTKTTVSTAVDQLKLAEEVMKLDAFRPIVAMPDAKDGLPTRIFNANDLIARYPELSVKGIKTGSSTAAGGALVWASYKGVGGKDQLILGVTMGQHAKGPDPNGTSSLALVLERSRPMIEAVRNALTSATTVKKGQVVGYVDDGVGGETPVVATKDLQAIGVPGQKIDFKIGAAAGKSVPHEAKAGTVVGELTVGTGSTAAKVPVALQKDLAEPSFGAKLKRIA